MEVPVRRILIGIPVEKATNRAAMSNVHSPDFFIGYGPTRLLAAADTQRSRVSEFGPIESTPHFWNANQG
jgi:hypothetical protein